MSAQIDRWILTASCPDRRGIVAAVASFLADREAMISASEHHSEKQSKRFFPRIPREGECPRTIRPTRWTLVNSCKILIITADIFKLNQSLSPF